MTTLTAAAILTLAGGTLSYDDVGSGPLVICVPGLGDVRAQYRFLAPALAAQGYRVVTVDLRGMGGSSTNWSSYQPEDTGRDLLALIDHLNAGPAVIVGNSFAAASAVWAAAERPNAVRGLVLIGPFVRGGPVTPVQDVLFQVLFARPWGVAAWGAYYDTLYPTRKPDDYAAYRTALLANLKESGRLEAARAMIGAKKNVCATRIPEVKAPTLVLMGAKDPDFKDPTAEANTVADLLKGRVAMVPDAGHYPHAEFPDRALAAILPFLKELK